MPANTRTEFRGRNIMGRDKRKLLSRPYQWDEMDWRKYVVIKHRKPSPFRGRIGNHSKLKGCVFCNGKLNQRLMDQSYYRKICQTNKFDVYFKRKKKKSIVTPFASHLLFEPRLLSELLSETKTKATKKFSKKVKLYNFQFKDISFI